MGRVIGIDLGTTNSVMAVVETNGCRILHNRENERQTRSVVGRHKDQMLVGTPALRRWPLAPKDTILSVKRLMGRAVSDPEVARVRVWALYDIVEPAGGTRDAVRVRLGGEELSPVDVSALILGKLKADAETLLGEPVTHAVITVPAYFSDKQRHATREAGLKAGLTVMKILDEPTAAAIAFGLTSPDTGETGARTIVVFDLGGGTFDVSVLMKADGTFATLNLEGDMWLGGDDFDQALMGHVLQVIREKHGVDPVSDHSFMALLKIEVQKAKETLSSAHLAEILIPGRLRDGRGEPVDIEVEVRRPQFEALIRPLVDRAVGLVKQAIAKANLSVGDIDALLLAGNATSVPLVRASLEALVGKDKVQASIHPKEAVAIGAAIAGATLRGPECPACGRINEFEATACAGCQAELPTACRAPRCPSCGGARDEASGRCAACGKAFLNADSVRGGIAPFSYGIQTAGDRFHIFIGKGDSFPTEAGKVLVQTFYTTGPNQRMISIPVYGGEDLERASRNEKQGEVFSILPPDCPAGTPVKVRLFLDGDGSFLVQTFLENGNPLEPLILRGNTDQKAVQVFMEAEEKLFRRRALLKPDQLAKVERHRSQTLVKMGSRDFDGAVKSAGEYLRFVVSVASGADPGTARGELLLDWSLFVLERYAWLLCPDDEAALKKLLQPLKEALSRSDPEALAAAVEPLDRETDRLIQRSGEGGRPEPTWIGRFMAWRGTISRIEDFDLFLSDTLRSQLAEAEEAMKSGLPDVPQKLAAFQAHLASARERYLGATVKCHACGAVNAPDRTSCSGCGASLMVLSDQRKPDSHA